MTRNPDTAATLARDQSLGEEIANAVSHGGAALLALLALPVLVIDAQGAVGVFAAALFGLTVVLLYLASTLYHALASGTAKRVFRVLDHSAIYLLIAGSYTPFALGVLREEWGWSMFAFIWALAGGGVLLKAFAGPRFALLSVALYLAMGWLALLAIEPLTARLPVAGLAWLVGGGVAYTLGVVFFVLDERVRYAHFVWHLFVMAGTACHLIAVLAYA